MTTLWLCPCTRPHMVRIPGDPGKERLAHYCRMSRIQIDLRFLCPDEGAGHIYVTRRRRGITT